MAKIELPSGSTLEISHTPWRDSKALFEAMMEEAKELRINGTTDIDVNLIKDLVASSVCSRKIDAAIEVCLKRVTLNGLKITDDTWDKIEARSEYYLVRYHVAKENILPFTKDLSAQFSGLIQKMIGFQG